MTELFRAELQRIVQTVAGPRRDLPDRTRLYHDLGVAGDDAVDLINEVHRAFGTTFEGFDFERYFPNEAEAMPAHWVNSLRGLFGYSSRRKTLTFGHLVKVVKAGRWFEPSECGAEGS
jgi:hypothetical protein